MFKNADNSKVIRKIVNATVALALISTPALSQAQRAPGGDIPRFLELGPKVGEQLPNLTIVNDLGQPVNIREITKGAYSVLVLGCLT